MPIDKRFAKAYLKQNLDFLKDREADVWEPLFAIAEIAVPKRFLKNSKRSRSACRRRSQRWTWTIHRVCGSLQIFRICV